jgi:hypothetical protein
MVPFTPVTFIRVYCIYHKDGAEITPVTLCVSVGEPWQVSPFLMVKHHCCAIMKEGVYFTCVLVCSSLTTVPCTVPSPICKPML